MGVSGSAAARVPNGKVSLTFERRPFPPGQHGRARRATSDYKVRLLEKQRLKAQYDLHEGQLRRAFDRAVRRPGKTGEELIVELESRLDALVLRAGFARTIYQARQAVTHQHVTVNGRRLDRPSARNPVTSSRWRSAVGARHRSSSRRPGRTPRNVSPPTLRSACPA